MGCNCQEYILLDLAPATTKRLEGALSIETLTLRLKSLQSPLAAPLLPRPLPKAVCSSWPVVVGESSLRTPVVGPTPTSGPQYGQWLTKMDHGSCCKDAAAIGVLATKKRTAKRHQYGKSTPGLCNKPHEERTCAQCVT